MRAYSNVGRLREPATLQAWLKRIVVSAAMDWVRAFRRPGLAHAGDGPLLVLDAPSNTPSPPEALQRKETLSAVRAAVASLPPTSRDPLLMFHFEGLSYADISDRLRIPLGTVRSRIHAARKKLRNRLAGGGDGGRCAAARAGAPSQCVGSLL